MKIIGYLSELVLPFWTLSFLWVLWTSKKGIRVSKQILGPMYYFFGYHDHVQMTLFHSGPLKIGDQSSFFGDLSTYLNIHNLPFSYFVGTITYLHTHGLIKLFIAAMVYYINTLDSQSSGHGRCGSNQGVCQ